MITPGLVSQTFKERSRDEVLSLMVRSGLKAIEWSEGNHVKLHHIDDAKETEKRCTELGIKIVALGSYYRLGQGMDFAPVLALAKALTAPVIRIWAGTRASKDVDATTRKTLEAECERISALALEDGIQVVSEWHKNTLTDTNASALALLSHCPSLKTLWQPTVALGVAERIAGLSSLGEHLVNLHVYAWSEGDGKRLPLEDGIELWREYLQVVSGDHYALLEFVKDNTDAQFLSDARVLKELVR